MRRRNARGVARRGERAPLASQAARRWCCIRLMPKWVFVVLCAADVAVRRRVGAGRLRGTAVGWAIDSTFVCDVRRASDADASPVAGVDIGEQQSELFSCAAWQWQIVMGIRFVARWGRRCALSGSASRGTVAGWDVQHSVTGWDVQHSCTGHDVWHSAAGWDIHHSVTGWDVQQLC